MNKRNKYLTPAMEKVLRWMAKPDKGDGFEDGELVSEGLEIWYGLHRTNRIVLNNLLRLCLISEDNMMSDEKFRRFHINEDGRAVLKDPNYVPRIIRALKARKRA